MDTAVVLAAHGAPMITIDVAYQAPGDDAKVVRKSMLRPVEESLGKTLSRMRLMTAPPRNKTKRLSPAEAVATLPEAKLLDSAGAPIAEDMSNAEAWSTAATLVMGDVRIRVKYNIPTVTSVTAPSVVYAGVPTAITGIKVLFSKQTEILSEWYLASAAPDGVPDATPFASNTLVVTPEAGWAGRPLLFRCRPNSNDSPWTETTTPPVVLDAAGFLPMPRWAHLAVKKQEEVRIVSYNLLHDGYATTKDALARIYPFCTKDVLNILYRRSRIAQELQRYSADIMCLQEVGRDTHERYYNEIFSHLGYKSLLAVKTGTTKEGCCIAYKRSRFEPVTSGPVVMPLSWGTLSRRLPDMAAEIKADHPHLLYGLKKLPSVGIFVALRDKITQKVVVVSNTHLYYHPDGCHIRALQTYLFLSAVMDYAKSVDPNGAAEIIAAGDYNFTRDTGGYRLVTTGRVEPGDTCWLKGLAHYYGKQEKKEITEVLPQSEGEEEEQGEDLLVGEEPAATAPEDASVAEHRAFMTRLETPPSVAYMPALTLPMPLRDTHPTDEQMRFSNYAIGFKNCIDHIFVTDGIRTQCTLQQPEEAELSRDVAIPSLVFPSDHIALVADISLT